MTVADEERNSKSAKTETSAKDSHNNNNPEHITEVHNGVADDLHMNENKSIRIKQEQEKYEDGYDIQEAALDLSPDPRMHGEPAFSFDGAHLGEVPVKKNISNVTEVQEREKDARDWAVKNILVIGAASVALSTLFDSYVQYCVGNGTNPLPISQLERLLKNIFPESIQHIKMHGVTLRIFDGLQLLSKSGLNQKEMGQSINTHVLGSDPSLNLSKENSTNGYSNNHSQNQYNNEWGCPQNSTPPKFDIKSEPVDLSIKKPVQSFSRKPTKRRLSEPFYGTDAEHDPRQTRRLTINYQHQVENRCPTYTYANIKMDQEVFTVDDNVENCKCAAKRLSHVINWMKDNGHTHVLLKHFAHSASCSLLQCSPFCMMFRRVRRHVMSAKHECVLLKLFSLLLRNHVNSCNVNNCGLQACPTLKVYRDMKKKINEEAQRSGKQPEPFAVQHRGKLVPNPVHYKHAISVTGNKQKFAAVFPHLVGGLNGTALDGRIVDVRRC